MNIKLFFLFLCGLVGLSNANAQVQTFLYTDLEDSELLDAVQLDYSPDAVLTYGMARDTMFGVIDNENNYVTCVYTGYSLYLNPSSDPSTALYMGGSDSGINTEHTYPQSKGAVGNAKSDLHHLFPTNTPVNSVRGSDPFAEISDNLTDEWYHNGNSYTNIPSSNIIDQCSEDTDTRFEPREDHKGDVARAMFYFYTIYRNNANNADANYFELQRETLIRWHHQDPVDEKEYNRTQKIATYQGTPNPFVIDSTLAYRMYCGDMTETYCDVVLSAEKSNSHKERLGQNFPNPYVTATTIPYQISGLSSVELEVFDLLGSKVATLVSEVQDFGKYEVEWKSDLDARVLFYKLKIQKGNEIVIEVKKMSQL